MKFLSAQGKQRVRLGDELGRVHPPDRRPHHDALRRQGLVLPPQLAPLHVVIVPIFKDDGERARVLPLCDAVAAELKDQGQGVHIDAREGMTPGAKYFDWEMKGVPLRIEIGPRDVDSGNVVIARRFVIESPGEDEKAIRAKKKQIVPRAEVVTRVRTLLGTMQRELFERAKENRAKHSRAINTMAELEEFFKQGGGFAWVHWAGSREDEESMAKRLQTSIRNIPLDGQGPAGSEGPGSCILTGKPSARRVVMAESY